MHWIRLIQSFGEKERQKIMEKSGNYVNYSECSKWRDMNQRVCGGEGGVRKSITLPRGHSLTLFHQRLTSQPSNTSGPSCFDQSGVCQTPKVFYKPQKKRHFGKLPPTTSADNCWNECCILGFYCEQPTDIYFVHCTVGISWRSVPTGHKTFLLLLLLLSDITSCVYKSFLSTGWLQQAFLIALVNVTGYDRVFLPSVNTWWWHVCGHASLIKPDSWGLILKIFVSCQSVDWTFWLFHEKQI